MGSIIATISEKGGTGKSSCTANLAAVMSESGTHVCVVEFDTNPGSTRDLGVLHQPNPDDGKGLLDALMRQAPPKPTPITDYLHVVPSGTYLQALPMLFSTWSERHQDLPTIMANTLHPLRNIYDVIFVDCAPGESSSVSSLVLSGADYALIPTKDDDSSLEGVTRAVSRIEAAQSTNARLMLLGVVLFDLDPRSTIENQETRLALQRTLGKKGHIFDTDIRTAKKAAKRARHEGLPVAFYDERVVRNARPWYEDRAGAYKIARNAGNVAGDYRKLADEIHTRIQELNLHKATRKRTEQRQHGSGGA